jgi:hypothetical protein
MNMKASRQRRTKLVSDEDTELLEEAESENACARCSVCALLCCVSLVRDSNISILHQEKCEDSCDEVANTRIMWPGTKILTNWVVECLDSLIDDRIRIIV